MSACNSHATNCIGDAVAGHTFLPDTNICVTSIHASIHDETLHSLPYAEPDRETAIG